MAKAKFYVVWVGRKSGIYKTWAECREQVERFPQAKYKAYNNEEQAQEAFRLGWQKALETPHALALPLGVITDSISVDAACDGTPGTLEYRGVDTKSGRELFHVGPIENGTNNLGEFLAIVHALALLKKQGKSNPIYSDSHSALAWVKDRQVRSRLLRNDETKEVWSLVDRALNWLENNAYPNELLKWETENWGEIRADFGRK